MFGLVSLGLSRLLGGRVIILNHDFNCSYFVLSKVSSINSELPESMVTPTVLIDSGLILITHMVELYIVYKSSNII